MSTYLNSQTYVYGHVFESLTTGLYPNKQEVLREYIQNAYDAIIEGKKLGLQNTNLIKVQIDGNNLFIHDNGIGMDRQSIEEYKYFGFSRKKMGNNVGFRGIGKLAGLAIAEKMVVVTKKFGDKFLYTYKCEAEKMLEAVREGKLRGENIPLEYLIDTYTSITSTISNKDEHYTSVQLYGVSDESGLLLNEKNVIKYLSQVAPVPFNDDFRFAKQIEEKLKEHIIDYLPVCIEVNGTIVNKPFHNDLPLTDLKFIIVPGQNQSVRAVCWYLPHDKAKQIPDYLPRGLTFRCRGFAVGDENLVRNSIFSAGRSGMVYWFVGEIHIVQDNIIPSSSRTDFEDTVERQELYKACRQHVATILNNQANELSKESSNQRKLQKANEDLFKLEKKIKLKTIPEEVSKNQIKEIEKTKNDLVKAINKMKNPIQKDFAKKTVNNLESIKNSVQRGNGISRIEQIIDINEREKNLYNIIMDEVSKWFDEKDLPNFEQIVINIHNRLKRSKI